MIEAGKVVTRETHGDAWDSNPEESIKVGLLDSGIMFSISPAKKNSIILNAEQTIEICQIGLRAAELQTEYAEKVKALNEERKNLDAKFKDDIAGLGLDVDVDVNDPRKTFTVLEDGSTTVEV